MNNRLTEKEAQILELIAKGYPNKQVAVELGMSPATVKSHLYKAYIRLHVHNRAGAVVMAHRQGYLDLRTTVQPHLIS